MAQRSESRTISKAATASPRPALKSERWSFKSPGPKVERSKCGLLHKICPVSIVREVSNKLELTALLKSNQSAS